MMIRQYALVFQAFFDFIKDSAELPLAFAGADNEVIGEPAETADIQQHDVGGLFFAGRINGPAGDFYSFQPSNLQNDIY